MNEITLDSYQQEAVSTLRQLRFGCLIGPAGTGKTTVLKELVEVFIRQLEAEEVKRPLVDRQTALDLIAVCSFTGRSVQQTKKALGQKHTQLCDTIHGTLGFHPVWESRIDKDGNIYNIKTFVPRYDNKNKLPHRIIIVDEAGMLPVPLWKQLYDACRHDTRIFFIGDIQQLPPPVGRSTLGFAMNTWQTAGLETVHRTNEDAIILNAHRILRGIEPVNSGRILVKRKIDEGSSLAFGQIIATIQKLAEQGSFDPEKDVIISGQNVGPLGQIELNKSLLSIFNPVRYSEAGLPLNKRYLIRSGKFVYSFAVGDKVMLTANIRSMNLTNGQMGWIERIEQNFQYSSFEINLDGLSDISLDGLSRAESSNEKEEDASERQASHKVTIRFFSGERITFQTAGDLAGIIHAYAVTCHKMQGSEARKVVVILHSCQARMLDREWLYTAVTRAQEGVLILYNNRGMKKALRKQTIKGDTIEQKKQSFIKLIKEQQDNKGNGLPYIPESEPYEESIGVEPIEWADEPEEDSDESDPERAKHEMAYASLFSIFGDR